MFVVDAAWPGPGPQFGGLWPLSVILVLRVGSALAPITYFFYSEHVLRPPIKFPFLTAFILRWLRVGKRVGQSFKTLPPKPNVVGGWGWLVAFVVDATGPRPGPTL